MKTCENSWFFILLHLKPYLDLYILTNPCDDALHEDYLIAKLIDK